MPRRSNKPFETKIGATPQSSGSAGTPETAQVHEDGNSPPPAHVDATPSPPPPNRIAGSTHETISGERRVKGYPVTRDELWELGAGGALTTICFSVAGTYINRSYDIQRELELTQGLPQDTIIRWKTKGEGDWYFGLTALVLGAILFAAGGAKIYSIIRSTSHPKA